MADGANYRPQPAAFPASNVTCSNEALFLKSNNVKVLLHHQKVTPVQVKLSPSKSILLYYEVVQILLKYCNTLLLLQVCITVQNGFVKYFYQTVND